MTDMTVANKIAEQLGGTGKLSAMIGAHTFTGGFDSLSFKFKARGAKGINTLRVTLTPMDLYKVEFVKIRNFDVKMIHTVDGVYADQLRSVIESVTGLRLSLTS